MAEEFEYNHLGTGVPARNRSIRHTDINSPNGVAGLDGSGLLEEVTLPPSAINKTTFAWTGARNTGSALDRDMESDNAFTNVTPFVIPYDCELTYISAGSAANDTWEAHIYKNGTTAASLVLTSQAKAQSGLLSVAFSAGDTVRLRQQNSTGSVSQPRITAIFKEI